MDHGLSLDKRFFKAHGHGNDYLVFPEGRDWKVTEAAVGAVCHRWRGVGGDGIVALLAGGDEPPFHLRMFNPDGSEFERSGNGLRVLGAYLFSRGRVREGEPFPVRVGGDEVSMEILGREPGGGLGVAVAMGRARMGGEAVGWRPADLQEEEELEGPGGEVLDVQPVSTGNPHCVVFREVLEEADLRSLGPFLTAHPVFPRGVNVQLARVGGEGRVEILIWERGVGRTTASGTSACASAAAAVHRGLLEPGRIQVAMEGGSFHVTVSRELDLRLEGPVGPVMTGDLTEGMLEGLETLEAGPTSGPEPGR